MMNDFMMKKRRRRKTLYDDVSYIRQGRKGDADNLSAVEAVEAVSIHEVKCQLENMASKKTADKKGVVAELLKSCGDSMLGIIASVFSDILKPSAEVPETRKRTRLKVLFKAGDPCMADN